MLAAALRFNVTVPDPGAARLAVEKLAERPAGTLDVEKVTDKSNSPLTVVLRVAVVALPVARETGVEGALN
jgi:hypothetical protein